MLSFRRPRLADLPVFASLPVTELTVGPARERMAVHLAGPFDTGRTPLVCIPGLTRNMADFADFLPMLRRALGEDWPIVLVDLKGRGRSSRRPSRSYYSSLNDARDLVEVLAALGLDTVVLLGQGYGGQVGMALAADHPHVLAGAVLIDCGPLSDPRGLVRLRNNLRAIASQGSEAGYRTAYRRILAADYPVGSDTLYDRLAQRTHVLDRHRHALPLFDPALIELLEDFEHDDILVPQWPYFDALNHVPLLLMRTQLTDQLRRENFDEMLRRRPDAAGFVIEGQGSPALLNTVEDAQPIADFLRKLLPKKTRA